MRRALIDKGDVGERVSEASTTQTSTRSRIRPCQDDPSNPVCRTLFGDDHTDGATGAAKRPFESSCACFLLVDGADGLRLLTGGELFVFAGPWTSRRDDTTGETVDSCTIITTRPNELVAPVHDRMPVVLPRDPSTPGLTWNCRRITRSSSCSRTTRPV